MQHYPDLITKHIRAKVRLISSAMMFLSMVGMAGYVEAADRFNSHIIYMEYAPVSFETQGIAEATYPSGDHDPIGIIRQEDYLGLMSSDPSLLYVTDQPFFLAQASSKLSRKWHVALRGEGKTLPALDPSEHRKPTGFLQIGLKYQY